VGNNAAVRSVRKGEQMKLEEAELKEPISQSLMIIAENSLANDRALLKMGEAIIQQTNTISEMVQEHSNQILQLQQQLLDTMEKLSALTAIVHTHFGPTVRTH
jgi:hypothetical protein